MEDLRERVFRGEEALKVGLVDEIGTYEDVRHTIMNGRF
jgi:ClpP class serine protease